ncbi:polar growth protein, partial [Rhizopus stolonifer]
MKGIINLKGYRVEVDSSIQTGKYCFKVHHEKERTFYFFTDQEKYMKDWIKALMKSTIERDFSTPVMSSSTIPTISLEAARRTQPRPPSTLFLEQRNRASSISYRNYGLTPTKEHPDEHIFQQSLSSPVMPVSRAPSVLENNSGFSLDHRRLKDSGFNSTPSRSLTQSSGSTKASGKISHAFYPTEEDEDLMDPESIYERQNCLSEEENESVTSYQPTPDQHELLMKRKWHVDWINLYIQYQIHDLSELSTGEILLELLEHLSQKEIKRYPVNQNQSVYSQMMDRMITVFEHMHQEGVPLTSGYTFRDVLNGREAKIIALLDDIRD